MESLEFRDPDWEREICESWGTMMTVRLWDAVFLLLGRMLYTGGENAKKNPVFQTERLCADSVHIYPHLVRCGTPVILYPSHVGLDFDDDFGSAQNI